jgi:tetratricopeptide (TPR) repeat protein
MALKLDGDPGRAQDPGFSPDEFKSELSTVVLEIVRGWNPDGAFMLVGEDYQWGDAASLEILSHLYELLSERPVLFLSTYRPEPDAPFMSILEAVRERYAEHFLEIELQPLPSSDARDLVDALIDEDSQPAESLRQVILSRSEGNPLFVEEIVHALAEQSALERVADDVARWRPLNAADLTVLSIPTSLQALLLERIDRLPPDTRRTLQQAAVLGRRFARRVLQEIAQVNGALDTHLDVLLQADLIRGADGQCCENLAFRHALIQEVAYDTILHRHRREFHRRAAETIERLHADRQTEYAGEIGYHYHRARDGRGVAWLIRAAEQAQSVYEPATVIDYANKAIELAGAAGEETPVAAFHLRGHARDMLGNYAAARADLLEVLELSRIATDRDREWQALIDLGLLWAEADYSRAGPLYQGALELARALGDERKIAHSLNRVGNWRINVGKPRSARDAHQEALSIFKRLDDPQGLAETLDLLGLASYLTADFQTGAASYRHSIEMFRKRGDSRGLSSALAMLALNGATFDWHTAPPAPGDHGEWLAHAREAVDVARAIDWRAGESFALEVTGIVQAMHGEPGNGLAAIRQALEIARAIEHRQWSVAATNALGVIVLDLLNVEDARDYLSEALAMATELGSAYWSRSSIASLAELHIAAGEIEQAAALLNRSIEADSSDDSVGQRNLWLRVARLALARDDWRAALDIVDRLLASAPGRRSGDVIPALSLVRGRALAGLGQFEAAIAELQAARERAEDLHDRSQLWRLHLALASAFCAQGDERRASAEVEAARAIVDEIAGRLADEPMRQVFLSQITDLFRRLREGEHIWI